MVPFNKKIYDANGKEVVIKVAQFQMGYKGYIQLAIRSGYYKDMDVIEIRKGEYLGRDKLTGKHRFEFIEDEVEREEKEIIGYMAYFEYLNGFTKQLYWTKEKMLKHADTYSKAFSKDAYEKLLEGKIPQKDMWKYSSFWYKDFDGMAFKTMLRQLISKWGIMSIDMQEAFDKDMATIREDGTYEYVENDDSIIPVGSSENIFSNEDVLNENVIEEKQETQKTTTTELKKKSVEETKVPTIDDVKQEEFEEPSSNNTTSQNASDGLLDDFFN